MVKMDHSKDTMFECLGITKKEYLSRHDILFNEALDKLNPGGSISLSAAIEYSLKFLNLKPTVDNYIRVAILMSLFGVKYEN